MANNKSDLSEGDLVSINPGAAIYEIVKMNYEATGYRCMIRQAGIAPNGKPYKESEVDVTVLYRATASERKARFNARSKMLKLWITPNSFGDRPCRNVEEAYVLIGETGVPQELILQR